MERVTVSAGAWHDLLIALGIANEEPYRDVIRWCATPAPHYAVTYQDGVPTSARLMGTAIILMPREEGAL